MTDLISRAVFLEAGVDVNVVPFNGDAPVIAAVLGDHVSAGSLSAGGWNPQIAAGKMRLLVSQEQERAEIAPDVPTLIELGYQYKGDSLQFMYGPKGLPPAIRKKLIDVFTEASRSKTYIDIAKQNALYDPQLIVAGELDAYLLKDRANNKALVQKLGLGKK
jgi:tripartite-type tricarboxylate transporter receptor subunit TctC